MNIEESRVKDEPICYSESISQTSETKRQSILVKEEPIDIEVKAEVKFSTTEEFAYKASIAFLNEETTTTTNDNNPITYLATTSNSQPNKTRNRKTNKLQKSKFSSHKRHYKCNICEKSFTNLERHKRIHTGERPYKCDVCKKSFTHSKCLVDHVRIHTGEKPYECNVCKKSFTTSTQLEVHLRTHTGERPFECDVCKKKFSQSSNLKKHKKIHNRGTS